ncbi:HTH domain-containing protein [Saccharomonospora piscinae]|uniref:helix-turn-helix domain-containing protein n=1 Tax=Saccharomonospora piscinae TaxID=687388 RepID=UPI0011060396|nr:helix-turn-helix domain-containing protein [Saccharomonospora piscinae]TLW89252.1 HTH domain-containing protein [Saccharomonospora piscinae]
MSKTQAVSVPMDEHTTDTPQKQRWTDRQKAAARQKAAELGQDAKKSAKSLVYRNRRQLYPLAYTSATAALGTTGALVAEYSDLATPTVMMGTGAVALGAGYTALRKVGTKLPDGILGRFKTGLAAGCAWCATLPLTGADATSMWLALGLGTVSLSARWWQRIRPGHPTRSTAAAPAPAPAPKRNHDEEMATAYDLMQVWAEEIGCTNGVLAGTLLDDPRLFEAGVVFTISLRGTKHNLDAVRNATDKIAIALGYWPKDITVSQGQRPHLVELRVVTRPDAIDGAFRGPVIVDDGQGNVWVEIGPYTDGEGAEKWHLFEPNSVVGGFVLGGKGSGKSRLIELIAIALRKLGVEIWYLDPQNGASSPALIETADWPMKGMHKGTKLFGNVLDLLTAIEDVTTMRGSENTDVLGAEGFTHTRERPAIVVIVDECHMVFDEANPQTGNTFGHDFGELDRIMRKCGLSLIGASQIYTMNTFGNSGALRSGMTGGNLVVMRMLEKSHCGLLPGHVPNPWDIPKGGGYGYSIGSDRDGVLWRSRKLDNVVKWMKSSPPAILDDLVRNTLGEMYEKRHEAAQQDSAYMRDLLGKMRTATPDEARRIRAEIRRRRGKSDGSETHPKQPGDVTAPEPPAFIRALNPNADTPGTEIPQRDLNEGEQALMDLLADGGAWSTKDLAEHLEVSEVTVRKRIRNLETRLVKVGSGRYRAKNV